MPTIKILLTNDETIERTTYSELEKAEFREELQKDDTAANFKSATVDYGDGHAHTFDSFGQLISELGKFGG